MVVDRGSVVIKYNGFEVSASAWQVGGSRRSVQGVFPGAVIVQVSSEGLVGRFPQTVSGQVERDGQVLVLLDCGFEPLFTVSGKLVVGQKRHSEGDVRLGRGEVAILEGLVDSMECSTASRLLQVGCHSLDGVDL